MSHFPQMPAEGSGPNKVSCLKITGSREYPQLDAQEVKLQNTDSHSPEAACEQQGGRTVEG